jgi:hypothetical protein
MAPKKVTIGKNPKRKIAICTIEMKKELITKWESGTCLSDPADWLLYNIFMYVLL